MNIAKKGQKAPKIVPKKNKQQAPPKKKKK
jgi:hypothetical protein